eukprot:tig00000076_g2390.t1
MESDGERGAVILKDIDERVTAAAGDRVKCPLCGDEFHWRGLGPHRARCKRDHNIRTSGSSKHDRDRVLEPAKRKLSHDRGYDERGSARPRLLGDGKGSLFDRRASRQPLRKEISLRKWNTGRGYAIVCPRSIEELLQIASEKMQLKLMEVWNMHGDKIEDIEVIANGSGEIYYCASQQDMDNNV